MKGMDRCFTRVKVFVAVTASTLLMSVIPSPASAATVTWLTIVGIHQANNMVGGITGGGQPWSTLTGHAQVDLSAGSIQFQVNGLVLAGGNSIGTPDNVTQVKGTLVCAAGTASQFVTDTTLVPLSAQGAASFSGPIGPIPTICTISDTAFLIRTPGGAWIANGAIRTSP